MELEMKELYVEGVATHDDPELCVGDPRGRRMASWRTPLVPLRADDTFRSAQEMTSAATLWSTSSVTTLVSRSAMAHAIETDFGGLKVRSKPATALPFSPRAQP
jgi:hypothetical protein